MPTLEWNNDTWNDHYDWNESGEEWSAAWGGSDMQWFGVILPRIHLFLPAKRILELAPGFGRWTHFLQSQADHLHVVDFSDKCIESCKLRFRDQTHITYSVNDGRSLDMVADGSMDFIFSFDSLVHCEADVMEAYVSQLGSKLTQNGVAFLHHSNLGDCLTRFGDLGLSTGARWRLERLRLMEFGRRFGVDGNHKRARSMTADKMRRFAANHGLRCISQETVNWGGSMSQIDCFSTLVRADLKPVRDFVQRQNRSFMRTADDLRRMSPLYGRAALTKGL